MKLIISGFFAAMLVIVTPASSRATSNNAAVYSAIDMPTADGKVVLAVDSTNDKHLVASQKLFMLLRLGARPKILDEVSMTHEYRAFFSPAEMAPFLPKSGATGLWRGEDEFEQEDARKRFLVEYRNRITRLIPSLPIDAVVEIPISTRDFSESLGGFDLRHQKDDDYGSNNLWGDPATASGMRGTYSKKLARRLCGGPCPIP